MAQAMAWASSPSTECNYQKTCFDGKGVEPSIENKTRKFALQTCFDGKGVEPFIENKTRKFALQTCLDGKGIEPLPSSDPCGN